MMTSSALFTVVTATVALGEAPTRVRRPTVTIVITPACNTAPEADAEEEARDYDDTNDDWPVSLF